MRRTRPQNLPQNVVEILRLGKNFGAKITPPKVSPEILDTLRLMVESSEAGETVRPTVNYAEWRRRCSLAYEVFEHHQYRAIYHMRFPVEQYLRLARDWGFEPRIETSPHGLTPALKGFTPPVVVRPDIPMPSPNRRNEIDFGRFPFWLTRQHNMFIVEAGDGTSRVPRSLYHRRLHPHITGGNRLCEGQWSDSLRLASQRNDLAGFMELWYNALLMTDDPTRNATDYTVGWFGDSPLCDICGRFTDYHVVTKDPTCRTSVGATGCGICRYRALCVGCCNVKGSMPPLRCRTCRYRDWKYKWPAYATPTYEMPCLQCGQNPWDTCPVKIGIATTAWMCYSCIAASKEPATNIKIRHYFQARNFHGETDTAN